MFLSATASVSSFYMVSQREVHPDWKSRMKYIPLLLSVGIGLCLGNARAVMEGLFCRDAEFVRTPKHRVESTSDRWQIKKYRGKVGYLPLFEIGLGLYFTIALAYGLAQGIVGMLPFLALFQFGFFYVGFLSFFQGRSAGEMVWRNHKSLPRIA